MTIEPAPPAAPEARTPPLAVSERQWRSADLGVRLGLWGFVVWTVREALSSPLLTAPVAPSATVDYAQIDAWYAIAGTLLTAMALLSRLCLFASAARLLALPRQGVLTAAALVLLGLELVGRLLDLVGVLPEAGRVDLALDSVGLLGVIALLWGIRSAVSVLGRRAPLGPLLLAVLLLVAATVLESLERAPAIDYLTFAAVAAVSWLLSTVAAFMAAVFATRARAAVTRVHARVAPAVDRPPPRGSSWQDAEGWASVVDGLRLAGAGLPLRLLAAALAIVIVIVVRVRDDELVVRLLLLLGPVVAGLSALAMMAGAHGMARRPSPWGVRLLSWAASGLLMLTLVIYAVEYTVVVQLFEEPLLELALSERLLALDLLSPLAVYVALWALLSASVRLASGFGLTALAKRARTFRYLVAVTAGLTLAFGGAMRHRVEFELVVILASLAFFFGAWLLLGAWALLARLADKIEATFVE
jgi:hypothetical protein